MADQLATCPPTGNRGSVTLADVVTLGGYAAGLWWSVGGPSWAAIVSIVADEIDGPIARHMGTQGRQGSTLDWGADVALTPLALMRLGREIGHPDAVAASAPLVLAVQARMRSQGVAPEMGSARAVIMLAALLVHAEMTYRQEHQVPRSNPRREERRLESAGRRQARRR